MQTKKEKVEYRFYINRNETQENTEDQAYKSYVIEQNNVLHNENLRLRKEVVESNNKIDELEEQDDFNTKRSSNIKGVLKNLHEIDKLRKEYIDKLRKEYIKLDNNVIREQNIIYKHNNYHFKKIEYFFYMYSVLNIIMNIFYMNYISMLFITCWSSVTYICYVYFNKYIKIYQNQSNYNLERNKINYEIDKILKAQDYIHEFIDSM